MRRFIPDMARGETGAAERAEHKAATGSAHGSGGRPVPEGLMTGSPGPSPTAEDLMTRSLGSFSESLDALRATCTILERKCTNLNWALEKANRNLRDSLDERERLASRLDGILRCLSVGVVGVDMEGLLIEFNDAAERITGYRKEDVLGTPYHEVVGRNLRERSGPLHTMESGRPVEHLEKLITTASGESIPVGFSTSLVKGEGGEVLGAVEVFSDLRKAKLVEEELLRTRTMAAVGEMAAEVAQQVRNPLAGLAGFTELLARDLAGEPHLEPLVRKIQSGVAGVESAVARLVENARPVASEFRSVNVAMVLEGVLDLFDGSLEESEGILLVRNLRCRDARARLDEEQIRQVVWNLLVNAREAMPGGGVITVCLEEAKSGPDGALQGGTRASGTARTHPGRPFVSVSVQDTGPGMAPDVAANAFAPFFTSKDRGPGLGLTAVRRIVTGHGGHVCLESDKGKGTRVTLNLPTESGRGSREEDPCRA